MFCILREYSYCHSCCDLKQHIDATLMLFQSLVFQMYLMFSLPFQTNSFFFLLELILLEYYWNYWHSIFSSAKKVNNRYLQVILDGSRSQWLHFLPALTAAATNLTFQSQPLQEQSKLSCDALTSLVFSYYNSSTWNNSRKKEDK